MTTGVMDSGPAPDGASRNDKSITDLHVAAAAFDRATLGGRFVLDMATLRDRVTTVDAADDLARTTGFAGRPGSRCAVFRHRPFLDRAFVAIAIGVVAAAAIIGLMIPAA